MRVGELYKEFLIALETVYEKQEAISISNWVFENQLNYSRGELLIEKNSEISEEKELNIIRIQNRLLTNEPIQYVLEEAWFYKEKFFVNKNVLIPRPETEELISWILEVSINLEEGDILDIGTGSGCISVMLSKYLPKSKVVAIDVSEESLAVAKINCKELKGNVNFKKLDFLSRDNWPALSIYNLIVSNPPYILLKEKNKLKANVTEFEPSIALFVPDNDPYIFYRKLLEFSKEHLITGGSIFVEVHEDHGEEIKKMFIDWGLKNVEIRKDIHGRQRMVKGTK